MKIRAGFFAAVGLSSASAETRVSATVTSHEEASEASAAELNRSL